MILAGVTYSSDGSPSSDGCTWELRDGLVFEGNSEFGKAVWPTYDSAGVLRHLWRQDCPGKLPYWVALPAADPVDLLPQLLQDLRARALPKPTPVFELLDREFGWAYVRTPLDFRAGGDSWRTVSITASVGPLWATVTAKPTRLTFDPGDPKGPAAVACDGDGPIAIYEPKTPGVCSYTYRNASSTSTVDGHNFTTSLTIDWQISWTSSTGAGGPLDAFATTSTAPLAVAEVKGLVVCTGARPQQGGC